MISREIYTLKVLFQLTSFPVELYYEDFKLHDHGCLDNDLLLHSENSFLI